MKSLKNIVIMLEYMGRVSLGLVVAIIVFLPFSVNAQMLSLLSNLKAGDSGEEVLLLQEWLHIPTSGVFDSPTEEAVMAYQKQIGIISATIKPGSVGPITRATLNTVFGPSQGSVAWVEGEYASAKKWNGISFETLSEDVYEKTTESDTLAAWIFLNAPNKQVSTLFGNKLHSIGFKNGFLTAKSGDREAIAHSHELEPSMWEHVQIIFEENNVTFVFNNNEKATYPLKRSAFRWSFFDSLFNIFDLFDRGDTTVKDSERTVTKKLVQDTPSFFQKIRTFVDRLFTQQPPANIDTFPDGVVTTVPSPLATSTGQPSTTPPVEIEVLSNTPPRAVTPFKPLPVPPLTTIVPKATTTASTTPIKIVTSTTTASTTLIAVATTTASTTASTNTGTTIASTTTPVADSTPTGGGGGGSPDLGGTAPVTTSNGSTTSTASTTASSTPPTNQRPAITMLGSDYIEITTGTTYTDPGVTASDPEDGDISPDVVVGGDTVDIFALGTYIVTYDVEDSMGETAPPKYRTIVVEAPNPIEPSDQEPSYTLAPVGETASLSISSSKNADPKFNNASISPLHVYVGQTQTLSVTVQSGSPITSVTATTKLDHQTIVLELEDTGNGTTFSTSWVVFDTHVQKYNTTFAATNSVGQTNSVTMAWSDPCAGITQGTNSSVSSNCSVSVVDGLDGASLTVPTGVTLTLNSGATWAWNPGTSITVDGAIVVNGTATLKKGYLFYLGSTDPTADPNTKYFFTTTPQTGYVDVATYTQASYYSQGYYYAQGYYYTQGYYQGYYYTQGYYYAQGYYYTQGYYYAQGYYQGGYQCTFC